MELRVVMNKSSIEIELDLKKITLVLLGNKSKKLSEK
jgi:hypothetical protein